LYANHKGNRYVVVHESAHYIYGVSDETDCLGANTPCLMEGNGKPQFCSAQNHKSADNTPSCWEIMAKLPYDLEPPDGIDMPAAAGPAPEAAPIKWIELVPQERTMLVIDRSSAITGGELAEEKYGAHWWVDSALTGDRFGIVSYATGASVDYPLGPIAENKPDEIHAAIDTIKIELESKSAVGDGLRAALNEIRGAGQPAATQVIVLLSDGLHDHVDAALLEEIATQTGGTFYHVDPALPPADREFELRLALQEISGIARENGGLVDSLAGSTSGGERVEEVFIEPGCQMATFALSWQNPVDQLVLELESPDGQTITPDTALDNVHPIAGERPYAGFRVDEPERGTWRLVVKPKQVAGEANYRLFAFSRNRRIGGGLISPSRFYKLNDVIPLQLQVYFDRPVTGLKVGGRVRSPGGEWMPLKFVDDGNQEMGDALAGDGLYSALFRETGRPGIYTVEVSVESDGKSAAYPKTHEWFDKDVAPEVSDIPPFRRRFKLAVAVGLESPK
jgi:hypothetical protein